MFRTMCGVPVTGLVRLAMCGVMVTWMLQRLPGGSGST